MLAIVEKLAIGVAVILFLTLLLGVLAGMPSAISAAMLGEATESPFAVLALVMLGWLGGFVAGRSHGQGDGAMRLVQVIASAVFLVILLWLHRESLGSVQAFLNAAPSLLVALVIWLFVVVAPWVALSEKQSPPSSMNE